VAFYTIMRPGIVKLEGRQPSLLHCLSVGLSARIFESEAIRAWSNLSKYNAKKKMQTTYFPLRSISSVNPQRTIAHAQLSRHLSQWIVNGSSCSSHPSRHFPQKKHSTLSRASQDGLKKKPASVRVSGVAAKWRGWGHLRERVRFVVDCFTRLAFVNDSWRELKASIGVEVGFGSGFGVTRQDASC
jgi:hypothetical protein